MTGGGRPRLALLVAGAAALAAVLALAVWRRDGFFHGYLAAFLLVVGVPLGALAILMVHHLTGGRWGWSVRPSLESALATLPLVAVLFTPLLLGLDDLYSFARPDAVAADHLLQHKRPYLNVPFWVVRSAAFFAVWIVGAVLLRRWGRRDADADAPTVRLLRLAAGGLVIWVVTVTFAAIDWIGALQPHWYSSVWGAYVFIGFALTAHAVATLSVTGAPWRPREDASPDMLNDLGNLLLMLVILHAYLGFAQFFVTWNGDQPHESGWYLPRIRGPWMVVAVVLGSTHFALPFLALLFRAVKRGRRALASIALLVLAARALEAAWFVLPVRAVEHLYALLVATVSVAAVGGLAGGVYLSALARARLLTGDDR